MLSSATETQQMFAIVTDISSKKIKSWPEQKRLGSFVKFCPLAANIRPAEPSSRKVLNITRSASTVLESCHTQKQSLNIYRGLCIVSREAC